MSTYALVDIAKAIVTLTGAVEKHGAAQVRPSVVTDAAEAYVKLAEAEARAQRAEAALESIRLLKAYTPIASLPGAITAVLTEYGRGK